MKAKFGFRVNVLERSKKGIPAMGIQYRLLLTNPSDTSQTKKLGSIFTFITSNRFLNKFALNTNLGFIWSGSTIDPIGFYSMKLLFPIKGRFSGFVEDFGTFDGSDFDINFDGGLGYFFSDDIKFDVSIGWQGADNISAFFINLGISWRIHNRAE